MLGLSGQVMLPALMALIWLNIALCLLMCVVGGAACCLLHGHAAQECERQLFPREVHGSSRAERAVFCMHVCFLQSLQHDVVHLLALQVNGGKLPDHVGPFCAAAAAIAAALPVLQHLLQRYKKRQQLQQPADTAGVDEALLVTPGYYVDTRKCSDDGSAASTAAASSSSTDRSQQFSYLHQQQQQHKRSHPTAAIKACLRQASRRLLNTWRSRTAVDWVLALLPSGVGFAVGMYLTANWTLPRVLGSIVDQVWLLLSPSSHAAFMMVTASGLVLGEGCASVVTAVLHAVIGR